MHISWQVQDFVDVEVQSWWPVVGAGLYGPLWEFVGLAQMCRFRGRCRTL